MTRLLLALVGFAVLPLATPHAAGAADIGARGESLRSAPASETPPEESLTRAWSRFDQVRSVGVSGFAAVAHVQGGPEPTDVTAPGTDAARAPHGGTLRRLPRARAPPA